MDPISLEASKLVHRVQYYLAHQKQNPDSVMALEKSLVEHIHRLTHQDLMTPVPSGENLLMHFISIMRKNDALTQYNKFILSALMERSLFLRLYYPHLSDATTFLLTSSNKNNQTPFQVIEFFQNRDLLDSYLKQVGLHLSRPLVASDVLTNKCTPWSCHLPLSVLFFQKLLSNGFRLLDQLVLLDVIEQFIAALDVLRAAFIGGHILGDTYKHVLLTHPKPNYSLMHELIMAGHVVKLEAYLRAINTLHQEHVINTDEYKYIFCLFNKAGYSAVHQAANAPNADIARSFLFFLDNQCDLPVSKKIDLFEVGAIRKNSVLPHREISKNDPSVREINGEMVRLYKAWKLEEQAQHLQVQGLFSVSPPATPQLEIKVESENEATDTESWSPGMSPLLWLPSSLK